MKYFLICIGIVSLLIGVCVCVQKPDSYDEILRVHIRANSNSDEDQNVKFVVKDSIVEKLSKRLEKVESIAQAERIIDSSLDEIEEITNAVLAENGFDYTSHAEVRSEIFPSRVYDGITFVGGQYRALIVELGSGKGNNWWCVMYPPLCFLNADGEGALKYKSIIYEYFKRQHDKNKQTNNNGASRDRGRAYVSERLCDDKDQCSGASLRFKRTDC